MEKYGRLTLPTDLDVIDQTIELKNKLGADAIRDCDGTDMPQELMNLDAKIYATSVSYTHLTLPTNRAVYISVVAA